MYRAIILLVLLCSNAVAHEMTPTYPKWSVSHIPGAHKTTMKMFNKRAEVTWYEIGVFTKDCKPIPFVSKFKIIHIPYLGHVTFDVYISSANIKRTEYICSMSKLRGAINNQAMIATKICSRLK